MTIRKLFEFVRTSIGHSEKLLHALLFACLPLLSACDSQPAVKPLAADALILAFGDSLTVGVGATPAESYPAVLEQLSGRKVINAGVSGETSDLGLRRLPDVIAEYQPQLIIICHGGNDILRRKSLVEAEQNIRAMIKVAKERNIDVVLIAVPAFNLWAESPAFYAGIANEFKLPFEADIIGKLQKNRKVKSDSVHFNAAGYRLLAEAVFEVLQEAKAIQE